MKRIIPLSALSLAFASTAFAGSSYVTGNVQFHSDAQPDATSTLEAGHTFDSGTTILTEFDGIGLGGYDNESYEHGKGVTPWVTLGVEQAFNITDNFWAAVGYHHLVNNGETVQYRPLFKIGYNFDNGLSLSNRTRYHAQEDDRLSDETRFDNRIGYVVNEKLALSYNNVYVIRDEGDDTMDHELRATWTRAGVQPYFEYRNQGNGSDNTNNAFVFGASYGF
ncbi:oligogalacturonate-specific porin KdgM family protein [Vibrio sp. JC009]|uniref:oligogalacturonate-specific porin KdgM family protein n=1 Tax=Vibrio sp. JC009 TaxID=2912314 RepID=UPI0023B1A020|nr:oligogalacturonate-specific porin KdgM family protein [Vibrio sp. JC009]WED20664.1 oligogalacturonate-specific porin KdgM family protein [Vibrio sp. JC009]